jgi:hypothetical protein
LLSCPCPLSLSCPCPLSLSLMSNCGTCTQAVANNVQNLQCSICKQYFHKKIACSFIKQNELRSVLSKISEWICHQCMLDTFPFCNLEKNELLELFIPEIQYQAPKPTKKSKCGSCSKKVNKNIFIHCLSCKKIYQLYHFSLKKTDLPLPKDWLCNSCSINELPFSSIADDNFL